MNICGNCIHAAIIKGEKQNAIKCVKRGIYIELSSSACDNFYKPKEMLHPERHFQEVDPMDKKFGPIDIKPRPWGEEEKKRLEELVKKALTIDKDGIVLKYDEDKIDWSVIPWDAMKHIAKVFMYGTKKYGAPFTYKKGIPVSQLFSAMIRHALSFYYNREDKDPDSGCLHLAQVAVNALMILSYIYDKPDMDDRPGKEKTNESD